MSIPKEILSVERPKNTVVFAYGKNKDHYSVRQRVGCKNVNGRHLPINGPTIGHIIDGKYVPKEDKSADNVSFSTLNLKNWANYKLCDTVAKELLEELQQVYSIKDAKKIYCIALARVCEPGIKDYEIKDAYDEGWLSEIYPDVALSKNTVSKFFNDLGKAYSRIVEYMRLRTNKISSNHHLLLDGTIKTNNSTVNTLSDFSFKSRKRGEKSMSVVFAFDLDKMEPICSKAFPGNMLDITSYEAFIEENSIKKGLIVADKGMPSSAAQNCFEENPHLYYLNPIKRNSKFIDTHNMLDFTSPLAGHEGILCKKEKVIGKEKWLYSYRDCALAAKEEHDWIERARKNNTYSLEKFQKKQKSFGTIVLESNLDMTPANAYRAYNERWTIEISMRYYKNALSFNDTRVHNDYSVLGSEFCDFIASIVSWKLLNKFKDANVLEKMTYGKVMKILKRAKKVKLSKNNDWLLIKTAPHALKILEALNLLEASKETKKRKRGRPKQYYKVKI